MTDERNGDDAAQIETVDSAKLAIQWRETPTVVVDQLVGFAAAGNVARVVLGEFVFAPGQKMPNVRPVLTLAIPEDAIAPLAEALKAVREAMNTLGAEDDKA